MLEQLWEVANKLLDSNRDSPLAPQQTDEQIDSKDNNIDNANVLRKPGIQNKLLSNKCPQLLVPSLPAIKIYLPAE